PAVMGQPQRGVEFYRSLVLLDGGGVILLPGVQKAQLQVRFGKRRDECQSVTQQALHLGHIPAIRLFARRVPKAHSIEKKGPGIARLGLSMALETPEDLSG